MPVELLQRILFYFFIMPSRLSGYPECHDNDILKEQYVIFITVRYKVIKKWYVKL